ncbi:MAG: secretin N-terminal domain-containing protein [Pirellula sp.]
MKTDTALVWSIASLTWFFTPISSFAIQPPAAAPNPPGIVPAVQFNLKGDTPLATLVEYVSQRLGYRFLYDESLAQKRINIQISESVPTESLFDLLQSSLLINGFAISKTDNPNWYRIVPAAQIPNVALPNTQQAPLESFDRAQPITQLIPLRGDPTQIASFLQPFLTTPGANVRPVPATRSIIVTDTASNMLRIQRFVEFFDFNRTSSEIRFVKAKHVQVDKLAEQLEKLLAARSRTDNGSPIDIETPSSKENRSQSANRVEVVTDERTSQLVLVGPPSEIERAIEILNVLDAPLSTIRQSYTPQFLTPAKLEELLSTWVDQLNPKPPFETRIEGGSLLIETTDVIQRQIGSWLPQIDSRETSTKQSPIRFYKIKNIPVQDILDTLNSLQGDGLGGFNTPRNGNRSQSNRFQPNGSRTSENLANNSRLTANGVDANTIPSIPFQPQSGLDNRFSNSGNLGTSADPSMGFANQSGFPPNAFTYPVSPFLANGFMAPFPSDRGIASPLGSAQVTADIGSNSLIIIAEPEVQQAYEQLIEFLDKRRPQVMIEARIVIIDTSDDYTLGVEVSGGDRSGVSRLFAFSSYGLSNVTAATGSLAITPGRGFNATLVDPSTADIVVRALATHRRARVLSSPKLLVDDNAEGTLESVNEVPFTSVNASQTVATTSFAGFAKAGTTITVTPTISEAKHVNMDYVVTLNSFTGDGADGVPPPRQTNEVRSRVTVPDGYTIIVGGLTQKSATNSLNGIPFLERIPIIRELSSLSSTSSRDNSLFVFLRPIILEEDKFRDLRDLSRRSAFTANEGHQFPASSPLLMK